MGSNIKPVLSYLRYDESVNGKRGGLALLTLPWIWLWRRITDNGSGYGRVACTMSVANKPGAAPRGLDGLGRNRSRNSVVAETPLSDVMDFLPLREVFGEYCQKALCSEVRCVIMRNTGCLAIFKAAICFSQDGNKRLENGVRQARVRRCMTQST